MTGWDEEELRRVVERFPKPLLDVVERHHFDRERWLAQGKQLASGATPTPRTEAVVLPAPVDLVDLPPSGSPEHARLSALGRRALEEGRCALIVLAGGMGTRMGGVVKALAEAVPGRSFLDLRLAEQASWTERVGKTPPLWLMTSHGTDAAINEALGERRDGKSVATFPQSVSLRWTPDAQIFLGNDGQPSLYAAGHGDLPDALAQSGLLADFVADDGRYVMVCNIDNLGGGLDPLLIGMHLDGAAQVSCEVVDKLAGDRGGIPVRIGPRTVIQEEFLLPASFDPEKVRVFNSNTMAFDADALLELHFPWSYFEVHKQVEGREVVQFERFIHETTFQLDTRYLRVPRDGSASRFLPVKDQAELVTRRPAIEALAQARGMLRKKS